jgi:predicted Zn-dependent protease
MNEPSETSIWLRWWPGLPEIWQRGDRAALILAISFALALNVSIASYGIWPHMMTEAVRMVWTVLVAAIWGLSVSKQNKDASREALVAEKEWDRGLFIEAQGEYLRGHWFEAESLLVRCLEAEPEDDAARLLLADVYRRAGEFEKANEQLNSIRNSRQWNWELAQNRQEIKERQESKDQTAERDIAEGDSSTSQEESSRRAA